MRFANLICIPPQEAYLDLLYLITQSLWINMPNSQRLSHATSQTPKVFGNLICIPRQAKTLMFPAAKSALDFLNNMTEFSSCGPPRINIGRQNNFPS